jgi:hypothetical protein
MLLYGTDTGKVCITPLTIEVNSDNSTITILNLNEPTQSLYLLSSTRGTDDTLCVVGYNIYL